MNRSKTVMLAIALAAACGGSPYQTAAPAPGLKLVANARLGSILADGSGRTLYFFAQDLPGPAPISSCTGGCLQIWPPFHDANPALGAGLSAGDIGQIVRADGIAQTTYKGFALYSFSGDARAGDVNGESILNWFALRDPFYGVMTLVGSTTRLTDGRGRTLYLFTQDTAGAQPASACQGTAGDRGTCAGNFPPFFAGDSVVTPTGLAATKLSSFTRADGLKQTAFDGHPLYSFADDAAPGDVKGLSFGPGLGKWFTVDPAEQ